MRHSQDRCPKGEELYALVEGESVHLMAMYPQTAGARQLPVASCALQRAKPARAVNVPSKRHATALSPHTVM